MSARRQSSQEEQERLLEAERARLRRLGLRFIVGLAVVLVVATVLLAGRGETRSVIIVFGESAEITGDVDRDDFVRVTGTLRRATDDDRFEDTDSANALFATKVAVSRSEDSAEGLTPIGDLRGDKGQQNLNREFTVIGEVVEADDIDDVYAIVDPDSDD